MNTAFIIVSNKSGSGVEGLLAEFRAVATEQFSNALIERGIKVGPQPPVDLRGKNVKLSTGVDQPLDDGKMIRQEAIVNGSPDRLVQRRAVKLVLRFERSIPIQQQLYGPQMSVMRSPVQGCKSPQVFHTRIHALLQ